MRSKSCSAILRLLSGEGAQGVAAEALQGPALPREGTDGAVEGDGGGVPVQHGPLHPQTALIQCAAGEIGEDRTADAMPARVGVHEDILNVQLRPAVEGADAVVPKGEADLRALPFRDQCRGPAGL